MAALQISSMRLPLEMWQSYANVGDKKDGDSAENKCLIGQNIYIFGPFFRKNMQMIGYWELADNSRFLNMCSYHQLLNFIFSTQ